MSSIKLENGSIGIRGFLWLAGATICAMGILVCTPDDERSARGRDEINSKPTKSNSDGEGQDSDEVAESKPEGGNEPEGSDEPLDPRPEGERYKASVLPSLVIECEPPPTVVLGLCEWASSFDVAVVGEILAVEPLLTPVALQRSGERSIAEECPEDAPFFPGVIFTLRVLDSLAGEYGEGDTVQAIVGGRVVDLWGGIFINSEERWDYTPERFAVGSTLGVGLYYDETRTYLSMNGQAPFTIDESGNVLAPLNNGCGPKNPTELTEMDVEDLRREFSACRERPEFEEAAREVRERRTMPSTALEGISYTALCKASR